MGNMRIQSPQRQGWITSPAAQQKGQPLPGLYEPYKALLHLKDIANINVLLGKALPSISLADPDSSHVYQYGDASDSPDINQRARNRERQANCGPSSAAMILNRLEIEHPDLHSMRRQVGAPLGGQKLSAYAISSQELVDMVELNATASKRQVKGAVVELSSSETQAYEQIRSALQAGKQVVLRTGNMESNGRGGHYVVVTGASRAPLSNLSIMDPQLADGAEHIESFEEFTQALADRRRRGMPNEIMVFSGS